MGKRIKCLCGNNVTEDLKKKEVRMKRVLGGLLLSALFLVSAPYSSYAGTCDCAGPGMHEEVMSAMGRMKHQDMGMKRPGHRMWVQLRRLNLDEKQKAAIRDIRSKFMKDAISKMAEVRIAKLELRDILAKDPVDMKSVEAKLNEIASLEVEMRLARIRAIEDVKAQLTPDQKKKFREGMEKQWTSDRFGRRRRGLMGMAAPDSPRVKMQPGMEHMDN
jgi:Spy/CpxP family protein refolding chaperone